MPRAMLLKETLQSNIIDSCCPLVNVHQEVRFDMCFRPGTSVCRVGGLLEWILYWRRERSQDEPCRLKAPTTAVHAFAFQTCNITQAHLSFQHACAEASNKNKRSSDYCSKRYH